MKLDDAAEIVVPSYSPGSDNVPLRIALVTETYPP